MAWRVVSTGQRSTIPILKMRVTARFPNHVASGRPSLSSCPDRARFTPHAQKFGNPLGRRANMAMPSAIRLGGGAQPHNIPALQGAQLTAVCSHVLRCLLVSTEVPPEAAALPSIVRRNFDVGVCQQWKRRVLDANSGAVLGTMIVSVPRLRVEGVLLSGSAVRRQLPTLVSWAVAVITHTWLQGQPWRW